MIYFNFNMYLLFVKDFNKVCNRNLANILNDFINNSENIDNRP